MDEKEKEIFDNIRNNILRLRKEHNMSVRKLADLADIDAGSLNEFELGKKLINLKTVIRLSVTFGLEPWELMKKHKK